MLKYSKENLKVNERQLYNKARDIDVTIYNYHFVNMPSEHVVFALLAYQNKDGGFGHALEIDNYNANSSVYQTWEALRILKETGFKNMSDNELLEPMLKKAFNYLYNRNQIVNNKWSPTVESNNKAVCAPWFLHNDKRLNEWGYAPTPGIVGCTLYFCDEKNPYYKKADKMAVKCIDDFFIKKQFTKEEFISFKMLYECISEKNLFPSILDEMKNRLISIGKEMIEKNVDKFNTYCNLPLEFFDEYTEDKEIDELIEKNLDYIIETLPNHGLWEATHNWNNEFPEAETALLKWMGYITNRNLIWLKKFNRFE